MIDHQHGEIVFECDGCDDTIVSLEPEWGPAKRQFDELGWKAEKVGGEWTHLCPVCRDRA